MTLTSEHSPKSCSRMAARQSGRQVLHAQTASRSPPRTQPVATRPSPPPRLPVRWGGRLTAGPGHAPWAVEQQHVGLGLGHHLDRVPEGNQRGPRRRDPALPDLPGPRDGLEHAARPVPGPRRPRSFCWTRKAREGCTSGGNANRYRRNSGARGGNSSGRAGCDTLHVGPGLAIGEQQVDSALLRELVRRGHHQGHRRVPGRRQRRQQRNHLARVPARPQHHQRARRFSARVRAAAG